MGYSVSSAALYKSGFSHDIAAVGVHRGRGDVQPGGNLAGAGPFGDQLEDMAPPGPELGAGALGVDRISACALPLSEGPGRLAGD